jgi:GH24 family phage-related lysozyme (muramidase)
MLMKRTIILLLLFFTTASVRAADKFNSTQKYQIMCWLVKRSENYKPITYRCSAGKKTVGWGFSRATGIKSVRNINHADRLFRQLISEKYNEVNSRHPELTYAQKAIVVSLMYNTGNLSTIERSNFFKHLKRGEIHKAIKFFKQWNKIKVVDKRGRAKYVVSPGLVNRRNFEAKLIDNSFSMNDYNLLKDQIHTIYHKNK